MGIMDAQKARIIMTGSDGQEIEVSGQVQEIEFESDPAPVKRINYEGSISGTFEMDQERIEQLVARFTPYSNLFKSIKMPDGKYLIRGKNRWISNYIN